MFETARRPPPHKDPLLVAIVGTFVTVTVVVVLLSVLVPPGQMDLPFFIPVLYGVGTFVGLSVGFLAISRFRVLPDPTSYWIAVGFFAFGILAAFFFLTFPGLGEGEEGLIARLPNTSAWIGSIQLLATAAALILAATAPWPRPAPERAGPWIWLALAAMLLLIAVCLALIAVEEALPVLVEDGEFSRQQLVLIVMIFLLLAAGAILSTRRYVESGDTLIAYVAITQIAFASTLLAGQDMVRFSPLWYLSRLIGLFGLGVTLFGLLSEYVGLYRKERRARAEAQERAEQLRATIESMADAVFVVDASGKLIFTNDAAHRLGEIDSTRESFLVPGAGGNYELRNPDGSPIPEERMPLARALAGETLQMEYLVVRGLRTEREVQIMASAAPVHSNGGITGAVAVAKDATEAVQLERMKDDFVRVAAHELKTPVTIIKGYAQALPAIFEKKPERLYEMLEAIDEGADRITNLVQDMLDISQLRTGKLGLRKERVELRQLVEEVEKEISSRSPKHVLRLDETSSPAVRGDGERLAQVLTRLVENAIKFSPEGGPIEIHLSERDGEAIVSVRDYGAGIPKVKHRLVFEPFFRAHAGTPLDVGGLGVGLHISREIVRAHGGQMWFESEENKGSIFYLSIPLENEIEESRQSHGAGDRR